LPIVKQLDFANKIGPIQSGEKNLKYCKSLETVVVKKILNRKERKELKIKLGVLCVLCGETLFEDYLCKSQKEF